MKKIQDYINKHPKLKRVAKIFGVVAIILSFLFNALIIGSLLINANKPNDSKVLAYGDYQPKMAYTDDNTGYTVLCSGDFGNTSVIHSIIYRVCEHSGRLTSYNNGLNDLADNANGPISANFNNIDSLVFRDYENPVLINLTEFNCTIYNSTLHSSFRELRIWCANASYPAGWMRLTITFNPVAYGVYAPYTYCDFSVSNLGHTFSLYHWGIHFEYALVPSGFNDIYGYGGYNYYELQASNESYQLGYDQGYSHGEIVGKSEGIEEGYASGYDAGLHENDAYNLGYTDGYNTGETAGYNQGYSEGSTGMSSNPFKLIANAFDAVASILNIQVLPNLTLGVIIFTPIIVIIILVVVKFIRG